MNKEISIIALIAPILVLSACDGGNDGIGNDYTYRSVPGLDATLSDYNIALLYFGETSTIYKTGLKKTSDTLFINANFYSDVYEPKIAELKKDKCSHVNLGPPLYLGDYLLERSKGLTAGEPVTISTLDGAYSELIPSVDVVPVEDLDFAVGRYSLRIPNAQPSLKQISMNIPGAEFPAISHLDIPDLAPLKLIHPAAPEEITHETVYRWIPDSDENSHIVIQSFVGSSRFACYVRDDGEFRLPKSFAAASGNKVEWQNGSIMRLKVEFHEIGTGAIAVERSSVIFLTNYISR